MAENISELALKLKPYIVGWAGGASGARATSGAGGGAIARAIMDQHLAEANPHPQYRLRADDIPLGTDVSGILDEANGGSGASNTGNLTWNAATSITGGGTLALAGFTLTVPATGTAVIGGGSGAANRIPIWSDANTLSSNAKWRVAASPRGGAFLTLINEGEALFGGGSALTSLYTNFHTNAKAVVEIKTDAAGGAGSNFPILVFSADHSGYVGPDAITGSIAFADRNRSTSYPDDLASAAITTIMDAVHGPRMIFRIATASTAVASAMEILATRAVWIGYNTSSTGTLTGAGDLDVAGNAKVASAATVGTTLTVPTVIAPAALTLQPASGSNITLSLANAGLLDLTKEFTTASGTVRGFLLQSRSAAAGASSATIEGLTLIAGVKEANAQTHSGLVTAFRAIALHGGTTTLPNLYGADFRSRANGGGTVSNTVNFYSLAELQNSSVITSLFCIRAGGAAITSGSVGTSYGVYIDPQKITGVTTGYGIYATGSDDTNYLAGNLGIGTSSAGVTLHLSKASALTNAVQEILRIDHNTSGTPAAGYGARLLYRLESSTTADQDAVALDAVWGTATHASRSAYLSIKVGATSLAEVARFDKPTTATQTSLMLFDVDNNTVERVTVGAADSGGTGFKLLRIPN
jgi:hypothetical protein